MNDESKPKRKFSRNSTTWQLFQKFFFLDNHQYPYATPEMPRGSAINLVQGLNCCNIQWAEEQGMPLSFLTLSAKAKSTDPLNPKNSLVPWIVEISRNQRHGVEGRKRAASTAWMQALLELPLGEGNETIIPPGISSSSSNYDTTSSPVGRAGSSALPPSEGRAGSSGEPASEPEISHMENALEGWLKGEGKGGEGR